MDHPCPPSFKGHVNDQGHAVDFRSVAWARPGGCRPALGSGPLKSPQARGAPCPLHPRRCKLLSMESTPNPVPWALWWLEGAGDKAHTTQAA